MLSTAYTEIIHRCQHISSMAAVQVFQNDPGAPPVIKGEFLPRKFVVWVSMKSVHIWCADCYPAVTKLVQIEA
jgi:hypothetical protein